MQKIIITADDYGMCPEVTDAIDSLALSKKITTTNVMMNFGTDFTGCTIKKLDDFSIGLHWNLTVGKPLASIPGNTLTDENGEFFSLEVLRKKIRSGDIKKEHIITELEAQYELFYEYFGAPSYWNTHENVALYPKEYLIFRKVALQKGIGCTRNFRRVYIDRDTASVKRKLRELAVKIFVDIWFGIFAAHDFKMPKARILAFNNSNKLDPTRQKNGLEKSRAGSVEVVIHPATSGDNPLFGNISDDRVSEFNIYNSKEMEDALCGGDRVKATFEDL